MSISAGFFFASALYVPSSGLPLAPSLKCTLPLAVNVRLVPAGGLSACRPRTVADPFADQAGRVLRRGVLLGRGPDDEGQADEY